MHKIHHSRTQALTDSNYSNLFSIWDRLFGTFTPPKHGKEIVYGLDELSDESRRLTITGLLQLPFADHWRKSGARQVHSARDAGDAVAGRSSAP